MADMYAVNGDTLTEIAEAIRLKRDITDGIPVADMAMQIGLIEGGGTVTISQVTADDELTNGRASVFFEKYMNIPHDHIRIIVINNTITSGNYARIAYAVDNGTLYRAANRGDTLGVVPITSTYEYFVGEGSILTIYDINI